MKKLLGLLVGLGGIGGAVAAIMTVPKAATVSASATADGERIEHASGQIKSFGPAQTSATILHKASRGSMGGLQSAVFTAATATQLQDFAVEDRVRFSFVDEDGRHVLKEITKQP